MPKVSVIIPCYNQGQFVNESVQSVLNQTLQDFEIIIVNDGSTDENTINILKQYSHPKLKIINTENHGLAIARNNGIKEASGKYILPLDADDKIAPKYLELAVNVLDKNSDIGIVYCNAEFFGAQNGLWQLPKYSESRMLWTNCVFCTAMYRKEDWQKVNGYNQNMIYGYEDWNFWLSFIENGSKAYKLEETLFFYRKHLKILSMHKDLLGSLRKNFYSCKQLLNNHKKLYFKNPAKILLLFGYHFYVWIRQVILQIIKGKI